MSYKYADRRQAEPAVEPIEAETAQPSMAALRSGAAAPSAEQRGHRVDLPDVMREKMENAFGADLSAVRLYESQTVAEAGAKAVARGSDIAFAPGLIDFTSYGGQALLGHEISHVVSQARGEVAGGGFLNDHALEARADREGAMAAAGQQVAMPSAALSPVTVSATTGPIQAAGKRNPKPTEDVPPPADYSQPARYFYRADLDQTRPMIPERDHKMYDRLMDDLIHGGMRTKAYAPIKERTTKNGYMAPSEEMFQKAIGYDPDEDEAPGSKAYEKRFQKFRKNKANWYHPEIKRYNDLIGPVADEQKRQAFTYTNVFAPAQPQSGGMMMQGDINMGGMGMMQPMQQMSTGGGPALVDPQTIASPEVMQSVRSVSAAMSGGDPIEEHVVPYGDLPKVDPSEIKDYAEPDVMEGDVPAQHRGLSAPAMGMMGSFGMGQQQNDTIQKQSAMIEKLQARIRQQEELIKLFKEKLGLTAADDLTAQD